MQQMFQQRKPQRRAKRSAETVAFPLTTRPAGRDDSDVDDLLAAIDALLDQVAA